MAESLKLSHFDEQHLGDAIIRIRLVNAQYGCNFRLWLQVFNYDCISVIPNLYGPTGWHRYNSLVHCCFMGKSTTCSQVIHAHC